MQTDLITSTIQRQNFRHAKVLIIEDSPDHMVLIERNIRSSIPEVEPILVSNEEAAFAYLDDCQFHEWKLPKLILLDIYMPRRTDGWRILSRIKQLSSPINSIPVVMMSFSNDKNDIRTAYDQGSASYLVKPTNQDEWTSCFQMLRTYWWETVALPQVGYHL